VKGFLSSNIFRIFPEAPTQLLLGAKINLEILNVENAKEYLLEEVIPKSKDMCKSELGNMSLPEFLSEEG
jgi:hypothetical protein